MKATGEVHTGKWAFDPLENEPVTAPRPNRYNEVQNLVLANQSRNPNDLTQAEQGVLSAALGAAGQMIAQRQQTHHAGQDDTALGNAAASLLYSLAYGVAIGMVTAGMVVISWILVGGDGGLYALAWLVLWGLCSLGALAYNRWQGLHFSPAGLAHHEIESRERVAMHAIDTHAALIKERLGLGKDEGQVVDVKPQRRESQ